MTTRATEYRYNVDGLLEELVCWNGEEGEQVTRWEYGTELKEDGSGIARADLVRAKVYPDAGRVSYGYNRLAEVTRMEDPNGTVHEYGYDSVNRFTSDRVTALDTETLDGAVRAIRVSYFPRGEIEKVTSYNSPTAIEPGNVVNEVLYAYNGFGQEITEWQSHAGAVTGATPGMAYGYENGSANTIRLGAAVFGIGHVVIYSYDGMLNDCFDRVSAIGLESGGPDVTYERLGMNAIVNTAYSDGLEMTVIRQGTEGVGDGGDIYAGLDRFGRLQEARWRNPSPSPGVDVERVEYGFDRVGNRQWRWNLLSGTVPWDELYRYDGLYQVTELNRGKLNVNRTAVNGVPAWHEQWRYDAMGNWLGYDTAGNGSADLEQERAYNAANELLFINGSNAQARYDAAGNMTRAPQPADWDEGYDLKWDAWNRLVAVSDTETEAVLARYGYDGLTRRITKETEISTTPVLRHFYYSNRWQVVEERLEGAEFADRRFVWGIKHVDNLVYRELLDEEGAPIERLWALNDGKNVTAVAEETLIVERYGYEAFGEPEVLDANFAPKEGNESEYDWETRFCGYRWDGETQLYQVRYRYYHPQLGRWITWDPLSELGALDSRDQMEGTSVQAILLSDRCAAYLLKDSVRRLPPGRLLIEGINAYMYVENSAIDMSDSSGLQTRRSLELFERLEQWAHHFHDQYPHDSDHNAPDPDTIAENQQYAKTLCLLAAFSKKIDVSKCWCCTVDYKIANGVPKFGPAQVTPGPCPKTGIANAPGTSTYRREFCPEKK